MREIGTVIEAKNGRATVEVQRKSACQGCHEKGEDCAACSFLTPNAAHRVVADNRIGACCGDLVMLEAATGTVLFYAALVFVLPLLLMFPVYLIMQPLIGTGFAALTALAAMLLFYALVGAYAKAREHRRCTVLVTKILSRADDGEQTPKSR